MSGPFANFDNDFMEKEVDRQDRVIKGLRDEIERLTAELDQLKDDSREMSEGYYRLHSRVDELEAGLETFGKHSESCTSVPLFCDCGLLKLKHKALEGEVK